MCTEYKECGHGIGVFVESKKKGRKKNMSISITFKRQMTDRGRGAFMDAHNKDKLRNQKELLFYWDFDLPELSL